MGRRDVSRLDPGDPRHGENRGYIAGCRDTCCRAAHAAYKRGLSDRRTQSGVDRLYVDARPTRRRIQALQANGWRHIDIDRLLGYVGALSSSTWSHNATRQKRVHVDHHRAVARLYDHLKDTPGPSDHMWWRVRVHRWESIDPVVVERILAGEVLAANNAERHEVMRRWVALGRPKAQLLKRMGWKDGRYDPRPEDAYQGRRSVA